MKRYTDSELIKMPKEKLNELNNAGMIDDDDWMRWHDIRMEMEEMTKQFFADLEAIAKSHPLMK